MHINLSPRFSGFAILTEPAYQEVQRLQELDLAAIEQRRGTNKAGEFLARHTHYDNLRRSDYQNFGFFENYSPVKDVLLAYDEFHPGRIYGLSWLRKQVAENRTTASTMEKIHWAIRSLPKRVKNAIKTINGTFPQEEIKKPVTPPLQQESKPVEKSLFPGIEPPPLRRRGRKASNPV